MDKIIIGCDIGGVMRDLLTEEPIIDAIESLENLSKKNYKIIFISKCKEAYKIRSTDWLKSQNLDHFEVYYCLDYSGKNKIALEQNVSMMIDDKMQVLSRLDPRIFKIWFCDDSKKIEGAKKYQTDLWNSVHLARNWTEVNKLVTSFRE